MKHQTKPNQTINIKWYPQFFLAIFFLLISQMAFTQPPPNNPPEGYNHYPFDVPVVISPPGEADGTIRFETINNTGCSAEFHNWFHVGRRNKNTGAIDNIVTPEVNFVLGPGQNGSITNFELFTYWGLPSIDDPSTYEYVILSTGVYLKFGSMSGYMTLLPNASGTTVLVPRNPPPCDCFVFHISSNGSKVTLRLDPCE
ncbi:MAG: hypothetical protein MH472_08655 [Bacteroidia bacterium]|nr:hypothetical protein [Bacteroidia bacterium]